MLDMGLLGEEEVAEEELVGGAGEAAALGLAHPLAAELGLEFWMAAFFGADVVVVEFGGDPMIGLRSGLVFGVEAAADALQYAFLVQTSDDNITPSLLRRADPHAQQLPLQQGRAAKGSGLACDLALAHKGICIHRAIFQGL